MDKDQLWALRIYSMERDALMKLAVDTLRKLFKGGSTGNGV